MTKKQEIDELIETGKEKAFQRRKENFEVSKTLGVLRYRRDERGLLYVHHPKTPEEIKDSVLVGCMRARLRRAAVVAKQIRSARNAERIRNLGYTINYRMAMEDRISAAYKVDEKNSCVTYYFAVRSLKDSFSRAGARKALIKHMDERTHKIEVKVPSTSNILIQYAFKNAIFNRINTCPWEFPSSLIKEHKRLINSPTGQLIIALNKYTAAMLLGEKEE